MESFVQGCFDSQDAQVQKREPKTSNNQILNDTQSDAVIVPIRICCKNDP